MTTFPGVSTRAAQRYVTKADRQALERQLAGRPYAPLRNADGSIGGVWAMLPVRNGVGRLEVYPQQIPPELHCAACGVVTLAQARVPYDRTTVVTCRCGIVLGEF